jgi:hypothetical protein
VVVAREAYKETVLQGPSAVVALPAACIGKYRALQGHYAIVSILLTGSFVLHEDIGDLNKHGIPYEDCEDRYWSSLIPEPRFACGDYCRGPIGGKEVFEIFGSPTLRVPIGGGSEIKLQRISWIM